MTIKKPSLFNKLKLAGILLLCYISLPLTSICNAAYQNNASGWCNDADMEDKPLFDNNNNPIMDPSNPTVQLTVRVPKSGVQCCGDGYLNLNAGEECDLGLSRNGLDENKDARILIKKQIYKQDNNPIMEDCECYTCKNYTRSYLHFLFKSNQVAYTRLACIHNVAVMQMVCDKMREKILED